MIITSTSKAREVLIADNDIICYQNFRDPKYHKVPTNCVMEYTNENPEIFTIGERQHEDFLILNKNIKGFFSYETKKIALSRTTHQCACGGEKISYDGDEFKFDSPAITMKCIIPKGSKYFYQKNQKFYISEDIIILSIVL